MLRIVNGRVYDPANGLDGVVRDVCVRDGRIVADVPREAKAIDHGAHCSETAARLVEITVRGTHRHQTLDAQPARCSTFDESIDLDRRAPRLARLHERIETIHQ